MLFNSLHFLLFFPVIIVLYYLTPYKHRWKLLLAGSYYFYGNWKLEYLALLVFATFVSYWSAIQLDKTEDEGKKKLWLLTGIGINAGMLFFFKYFNFANDNFRALFSFFELPYGIDNVNVLLPIGISFYTFQTVGYVIDVYLGIKKPEKNFGIFALFVSFFPQLVMGPIERSVSLLPQFYKNFDFDYNRVASGLRLMLVGFFKKVVVADRLAYYTSEVFRNPDEYQGLPTVLAIYFFAWQIYCDFSGYSDIAIGSARVMGFTLMDNFKQPLLSKNLTDFWNRWHISLFTWMTDYIYTPVAIKYKHLKVNGIRLAIMATLLFSGIWHKASWTFVLWGALHGIGLIIERATYDQRKKLASFFPNPVWNGMSIFITFNILVMSLILFVADDMSEASTLFSNMFKPTTVEGGINILHNTAELVLMVGVIIMLEVFHLFERNAYLKKLVFSNTAVRWTGYVILLLMLAWFGVFIPQEFIYMEF